MYTSIYWLVETAKKLEKTECLVVKDRGEIKVLKARDEGKDQKS